MAETQTPEKFEPHLTITVGSHTDLWHRFKKPQRHPRLGVFLTTRCGKEIYDHYNVRAIYNPRIDRFCGKCFPYGVTSEGRPKSSKRDEGSGNTSDVGSTAATTDGKREDTSASVPITSTAEPLVSESDDAGDGGAASEEGSGVLGSGHTGHVEELSKVGESGDSSSAGSAESEGRQGKSVRESGKGQSQRPAGERKLKDNPS